jgi:DAK2 domain fusion protein YloV
MIIAGANNLNKNKQMVDELNVFPVPDGDTGTNMSLTVLAAAREVAKTDTANIYEVAKAAANGSLRGARGNSGVILSQLFRGFSKGLEGLGTADAYAIANAFRQGVTTAYKAVMKPKEGTILTVAKEVAQKASSLADETDDLEILLRQTLIYGQEVLDKTPDMLPVLKQAGVVDAGGKGLLCILQGAFDSIAAVEDIKLDEPAQAKPVDFSAIASVDHEDIEFGYCTEFFINIKNSTDKMMSELKAYLDTIGDSIVAVNDDEIIKIHVHTNRPGQVLEKALTIGSLSNLKIENMREQHTAKIDFDNQAKEQKVETTSIKSKEPKQTAFIAIAMGSGIADIFRSLGVDVVIEGGQTMNPSTEDILEAVEGLNAKNIIILPNNKNIILAAQQAAELTEDKKVIVLPTKTIPQGISAVIGYDETSGMDSAVENMKKLIASVKTGQLTFAVRDTMVNNKEIKQGNILGIVEDDIEVVCENLEKATQEVVDKLIDEDSEIVSIYYGQDVTELEANELAKYIEQNYPDCDIEIHNGQQPLYYFIISAE